MEKADPRAWALLLRGVLIPLLVYTMLTLAILGFIGLGWPSPVVAAGALIGCIALAGMAGWVTRSVFQRRQTLTLQSKAKLRLAEIYQAQREARERTGRYDATLVAGAPSDPPEHYLVAYLPACGSASRTLRWLPGGRLDPAIAARSDELRHVAEALFASRCMRDGEEFTAIAIGDAAESASDIWEINQDKALRRVASEPSRPTRSE
jgi:hypothetical protein